MAEHGHLVDFIASGYPVLMTMLLAGLLGGLTHCAGMCGPFVMAQVAARLDAGPGADFGVVSRLRLASLIPYHLGRLTTYTALGAAAGALGSVIVANGSLGWLSGVFLILAATIFLAQAFGHSVRISALERVLSAVTSRLQRSLGHARAKPEGLHGYLLGVTLGFLPCGLLYGALAASLGCGAAWIGAANMAAFTVGTFPALLAVGYGGVVLGAYRRAAILRFARPLMVVNAMLLIALAVRDFI